MSKNILIRGVLFAFYIVCLFLYVVFDGSKYDWMDYSQVGVQPPSSGFIEGGSGSRSVFRGGVATLAISVQLVIIWRLSKREAALTLVLLCVVLMTC